MAEILGCYNQPDVRPHKTKKEAYGQGKKRHRK